MELRREGEKNGSPSAAEDTVAVMRARVCLLVPVPSALGSATAEERTPLLSAVECFWPGWCGVLAVWSWRWLRLRLWLWSLLSVNVSDCVDDVDVVLPHTAPSTRSMSDVVGGAEGARGGTGRLDQSTAGDAVTAGSVVDESCTLRSVGA